jgi:hypothetical protein
MFFMHERGTTSDDINIQSDLIWEQLLNTIDLVVACLRSYDRVLLPIKTILIELTTPIAHAGIANDSSSTCCTRRFFPKSAASDPRHDTTLANSRGRFSESYDRRARGVWKSKARSSRITPFQREPSGCCTPFIGPWTIAGVGGRLCKRPMLLPVAASLAPRPKRET